MMIRNMNFTLTAVLFMLAGCGTDIVVTHSTPPTAVVPPPVVQQLPPPPPIPIVDETAVLQARLDQGGVVRLDGRAYHISHALKLSVSGTTLQGQGTATVIEFMPEPAGTPRNVCVNDRVLTTPCGMTTTLPLKITAPIAVGATTFESASAATLHSGDWVVITLSDPGIADATSHLGYPTSIDWMQVDYVDGTTVHTATPFRLAFTDSLAFEAGNSGLGFQKAIVTENLTIEDLSIRIDAGRPAVGIYVLGTRNTQMKRLNIVDMGSDPLYVELSQGTSVVDSTIVGGLTLNEFAESVDLHITGNSFTSGGLALALDLGTGFFTVENNTIERSVHIAIYAIYHVHDGSISGNTVKQIATLSGTGSQGILVYGSPSVAVTNNTLAGADGTDSVGITLEANAHAALLESSAGDTAMGNIITGFSYDIIG